jgi:hypothetical protein
MRSANMNRTAEPPRVRNAEESAVRPPDRVSLPALSDGKESGKPEAPNLLSRLAASIRRLKPAKPAPMKAPVVHERPRWSFD